MHTALALLAAIDSERERLRHLTSASDAAALSHQPANGRWSAIENVRHLLFAEQAHLGQFIPGGPPWHPLCLPPPGIARKLQLTPADHAPTIAELLAAWDEAHATARPFLLAETDAVHRALDKNLRHLRNHAAIIERLLRARSRAASR